MSTLELILVLLFGLYLVSSLIVLIWLFKRTSRGENSVGEVLQSLRAELLNKQMDGLVSLRESLDRAGRLMDERLAEGNVSIDKRLSIISEIENRLGQLQQQTTHIEKIGNNIQSLSELLRPPKVRGGLGEMFLENMLSEILPPHAFETQHRFDSGRVVDAVVKVGNMLLPIDSKFPLESYQRLIADDPPDKSALTEFSRSFRKHIEDIAGKYILPKEGTTDIALMYIPAEAIYTKFVSDLELDGLSYALSRRVIPTSPAHLYGFLVSLMELYRQTALGSAGREELAHVMSELTDCISRLKELSRRMDGSLKSISSNLNKSGREVEVMESGIRRLRDPQLHHAEANIGEDA